MNPLQEIAALEDLIDQILRGIQEAIQSGEVLSDEFQGMIAQELSATTDRIDALRAQENEPTLETAEQEQEQVANEITPPTPPTPPANGGPVPQLDAAPHESSNINAFRYDPKSGKLIVKFQDKFPGTNGPVYEYSGVPENIYDVFRRGAVVPKTSGKNGWHRWKKGIAPSHGASMYALIKKGGFEYRKLR